MRQIRCIKNALSKPLFERLLHAVESVGTERMEDMGSYDTTFWWPLGVQPTNVVEESIARLLAIAQPGAQCVGMEWWLGRLKYGQSLRLHTDRDRSLRKLTGEIVHPLWSSILYLNRFASSPTLILDQVLGPDGSSWVPPEPKRGRSLEAIPNRYVIFRGDLRHGVIPREIAASATPPVAGSEQVEGHPPLRLTLLVNYWDRQPMPPNCRPYDGTIYAAISSERLPTAA
jgi:hypothetical protein